MSEINGKNKIDPAAMFKFSYGLYVLTAKTGEKDNGCIINTAIQVTSSPLRMSIAVSKANYTHDMIKSSGIFNISILSTSAPFKVFEHFGFQSGRDTDKFADCENNSRTANGLRYTPKHTNCVISGKVTETYDYETHTVFIAEITESIVLSDEPSVTYQYYFDNIKPKPQPKTADGSADDANKKKGFVCIICNYVYEGESLPPDYICPICKHGVADFKPL